MKLMKRGVALALIAAWGLASLPAQAYEKDKTYKITILHTNDHHGHFWRSEYGEYGLSAQKTLVDGIRKDVAAQGVACCCCPVEILIPAYQSQICRMQNRISAA